MTKRIPVDDDKQYGPFTHIEFILPTSLRRKIVDPTARERIESRLRTITSKLILTSSIKLKVPTHKATQNIKENRQSIIRHLEKAYRIMESESFLLSFHMILYASTPEERVAWMRFPDDLRRVIGIYEKSFAGNIFPTKGWLNADVATDVERVLTEEDITPTLSINGVWAKVTKYVIETATGKSVSNADVMNGMRKARSLSVARAIAECKYNGK